MTDTPNPGSQEAIEKGCTCPVMDNHHGAGVPRANGTTSFWYDADCPLHRPPSRLVERVARAYSDAASYGSTRGAWEAAIAIVLEEAAKVCDAYAEKDWALGEGHRTLAALDLAAAIRALKEKA